ncbi:hypothetical protein TGME49_229915 [Toxoplasma gondii ME49]|uniref:Dynein regulatory complex protein 10 n=2 Tax=Toxoplasma gondii TaxID=5811 RepID=A0A125YQP4_TOXGV|nr:hypothetical protein TGME49_229915 [Toxoplasma gondii ME49]EPT29062.1 hypothetical protein TGME49_229915 [Toxoplasma gondii ME49]ESS35687.1 hypothetical protein TGVEG_229915 [Toxoplasma gondii VEG]|eukprot:XP_018636902.1 hypothetical protein TGME49_229915 [Toxoplasma gondii ME49]
MAESAVAPSATKSNAVQLTPVEAFRACVLIDEALRQLSFVSKLVPAGHTARRDELSLSKGDDIVRMIQEQSSLQEKFKELTDSKQQLRGLSNIEKLKSVEAELEEVSQKLREANKELCRNLKQNPNLQENAVKLQLERQKVEEWYADVRDELQDAYTFKSLQDRVAQEKHQQEKLNEVKKRTRESAQAVRLLEAELKKETAEYEREMKQTNAEISSLKEELQQNRLKSSLKLSFEEKQLAAQEQALLRVFQQKEIELQRQLAKELSEAYLEEFAHTEILKFSREYIQNVQDEKQAWHERFTKETEEKQKELTALLKHQNSLLRTLAVAQQRLDEDRERKDAEEKAAIAKAAILVERSKQAEKLKQAASTIRHFARLYLKRIQETLQESKKNKGKGKLKGKGKR